MLSYKSFRLNKITNTELVGVNKSVARMYLHDVQTFTK